MTRATVIRGGLVLTPGLDQPAAADILVTDGVLAAIGPNVAAPPDAVEVAAANRLLIPGLINAHSHGGGNLARSLQDRWTLELLLSGTLANVGNQTLEDKYLSALLGALEMVSKGCTACYDLFYEFPQPSREGIDAVARAYADVGMRAVIAPMLADRSFYQAVPGLLDSFPEPLRSQVAKAQMAPWAENLALLEAVLRDWRHDHSRQTLALAPTIPMHCTDAFLARAAAATREWGVGFHTHLAESRVQAVYGLQSYGCSLTAHLDRLGVLGPNFTAAHAVWIDDEDVKRLTGAGAAVSHNPGSNMRLGAGLAAVRRMLDGGLAVGLGTDSRVCSDNLNMFEAMRLANYVSRVQGPDETRWLTTREAFAMGTAGSARALGFGDRLGRLETGFQADIVFLDLANLNYMPLNDAINQAVNAEDGTAVDSVMIGGRMVYENRRFPGFDMADLQRRAQAAADRMRAANAPARALAAQLEPMVASFCGALARHPHHIHRYAGGDQA